MSIIAFPNILPETHDLGVSYNTQVAGGRSFGVSQTVELPGARWKGSMTFRDMTPTESATLKAFLLQLRGSSGSFYYGDLAQTVPFNAVTGSPTIETGSTHRFIRVTLGGTSPAFVPGDYIQIGTDTERELKMVISSSNVGGDTYDLIVEPRIRRTDFIGLPVVYNNPTGVFFLDSDEQAFWSVRTKAHLSDIIISFVEKF